MRRLILVSSFIILAFAIGACASPATPPPTSAPVVQTVVVPQTVVSQATVVVPQTVVSQQTVVAQQTVVVTPQPSPSVAPKFAGTTLKYIDNPDGQTETFLALVKQCEDSTGITLNTEVVPPDDVNTKLETALAAKQDAYDIFALDIINLPKYAAAGWVAPLDNYMSDSLKADVLPFAQQAAQYQGHWLGLPFKAEFMSFIYNKKMLQDAGIAAPPKTLDELVQQSQTLKQKGIAQFPIAFTWGAGYEQITVDWTMFTKAYGGDVFDANGNPVFNKGAGVQALQLMNDFVNKYKIVDPAALTLKGGGTRSDIVTGGKAAFVYLWSSPLITMNDPSKSSFPGDFASALAPAGAVRALVAGPEALSISAYSQNKDAAYAFIQCLAGPAGEKYLLLNEGDATGYKSVLNDPEVTLALQKAGGDVQAQQALFLAVRPALPYYSEWSADVQQEVQNVLTGQKTVQAALDDLAKATTDLQAKFKQ